MAGGQAGSVGAGVTGGQPLPLAGADGRCIRGDVQGLAKSLGHGEILFFKRRIGAKQGFHLGLGFGAVDTGRLGHNGGKQYGAQAGRPPERRSSHENSPRRDGAFVVVDCASLPATIVESVLFGSEKGVYTGADRRREGLLLKAHGGTLFLDEVGEMPLSVQKAFLRVLQERRVRPVGGLEEAPCHFRLVAATNQTLEAMSPS